jgi:hypothetical protein
MKSVSGKRLCKVIERKGWVLEPTWHGQNLAALNNSWVTGDINQTVSP